MASLFKAFGYFSEQKLFIFTQHIGYLYKKWTIWLKMYIKIGWPSDKHLKHFWKQFTFWTYLARQILWTLRVDQCLPSSQHLSHTCVHAVDISWRSDSGYQGWKRVTNKSVFPSHYSVGMCFNRDPCNATELLSWQQLIRDLRKK